MADDLATTPKSQEKLSAFAQTTQWQISRPRSPAEVLGSRGTQLRHMPSAARRYKDEECGLWWS